METANIISDEGDNETLVAECAAIGITTAVSVTRLQDDNTKSFDGCADELLGRLSRRLELLDLRPESFELEYNCAGV